MRQIFRSGLLKHLIPLLRKKQRVLSKFNKFRIIHHLNQYNELRKSDIKNAYKNYVNVIDFLLILGLFEIKWMN